MKTDAIRHNFIWNTKAGSFIRNSVTWCGVKMLRTGRKLLKWSAGRCSWCGANPGFDSIMSGKGLRCDGLNRKCTDKPDV